MRVVVAKQFGRRPSASSVEVYSIFMGFQKKNKLKIIRKNKDGRVIPAEQIQNIKVNYYINIEKQTHLGHALSEQS